MSVGLWGELQDTRLHLQASGQRQLAWDGVGVWRATLLFPWICLYFNNLMFVVIGQGTLLKEVSISIIYQAHWSALMKMKKKAIFNQLDTRGGRGGGGGGGSVIIYTALVFQCSRVKKGAVTVINRKVVFSIWVPANMIIKTSIFTNQQSDASLSKGEFSVVC